MNIELASKIVKYADDKKASDIKLLNISELTTIADYFVICHANSNTQMNAIFGEMFGRIARYFLMLLFIGAIWPMTFKFFAKLGGKKA